MKIEFFNVILTKSSETAEKNFFKSRNTVFIPDFFLIFFCTTLFLFSIFLDLSVMYSLFVKEKWTVLILFVIISNLHSFCEAFMETKELDEHSFSCSKFFTRLIYFFGYGPFIICVKILIENSKIWKTYGADFESFPYLLFFTLKESLSILKIHSFICLVLKIIPQLFILCILTMEHDLSENFSFMLVSCIITDMLIFSQTIALMLPIRQTPLVYNTSACVVLSAINKFFATMCACGSQLAIFAMLFKEMKYYAVLAHFLKSAIWLWPCWKVLQSQPVQISKFQFPVYLISFFLIFSFIYIHPFQGHGKLYYYIFYLLSICFEIYFIYYWSESAIEEITYYFMLKILMIGFLSYFGLGNNLHNYENQNIAVTTIKSQENVHTQKTEQNEEENKKKEEPQMEEDPEPGSSSTH